MFDALGLPEIIIMAVVAFLAVWPVWRILSKAGYPGWLGISLFIPLVNFVILFYLAFTEWPIERELKASKTGT